MNKNIIIAIAIVVLLVGGGFYIVNQQSQNTAMEAEKMMKVETKGKDTAMMEKQETKEGDAMMGEKKEGMMTGYTGTVLAGKSAPYIEFNKADYDKALSDGKVIFLEFYANWCPVCRAQEPKLFEGFDALTNDNVVGFRVNYNDDQTDDMEKQLAKDFGVTYQHTHVILKDGKVVSKSNDDLDKESFVTLVQNTTK
ncbi:MAG: thioredoxin family protein [Candidatus Levybacteria bacterium]|nr:thioredoxin family protein [Candidatus Levybacteria bacterium]